MLRLIVIAPIVNHSASIPYPFKIAYNVFLIISFISFLITRSNMNQRKRTK